MLAPILLAALLGSQVTAPQQPTGSLTDIRVQGNVLNSDDEVIRLSGARIGEPVDDGTVARVEAALNASKRFKHVEVLRRFASLSDPTAILLVVIVDEGPVKVKGEGADARIVRSGGPHLLFLPLLGYEDGYGFSYGAQFAKDDPLGSRSRLSFPLTWGGDKRAGADLDKEFSRGPLTRAQASFSVSRQTNPFFEAEDSRVRLSARAERQVVKNVTLGASAAAQHVSFLADDDRVLDAGADIVVDTRRDPMLARNAVYAKAAWDHVNINSGAAANRTTLDARGYVGLIGQTILVARVLREGSNEPLPAYLKPLLGGMDTLRGFPAGYKAGDTLVSASAELRVPLTSPLSVGKLGVRAFVDTGTAYQNGERFRDQPFDRGFGGGVWFSAAVLRLNLDVAHGVGGSTRVHFGTALSF